MIPKKRKTINPKMCGKNSKAARRIVLDQTIVDQKNILSQNDRNITWPYIVKRGLEQIVSEKRK